MLKPIHTVCLSQSFENLIEILEIVLFAARKKAHYDSVKRFLSIFRST